MVREAIGDELERLSDPRLGLVTVTGVDVTADLRQATVYYSALGRADKRGTGVVPELEPDNAWRHRLPSRQPHRTCAAPSAARCASSTRPRSRSAKTRRSRRGTASSRSSATSTATTQQEYS